MKNLLSAASPYKCTQQLGLGKLESGVSNSMQVLHMGGSDQSPGAIIAASQAVGCNPHVMSRPESAVSS